MILPEHQCFSDGDELWIIPDEKLSPINAKLNWLINFQLSKAEIHPSAKLNPWIVNCLQECNLEAPRIQTGESLLIPVANFVPAYWLCQLTFRSRMQTWVESIYKIWNQMHRPKLRIYLPKGAGEDDWKNFWVHLEPNEEPNLVVQ